MYITFDFVAAQQVQGDREVHSLTYQLPSISGARDQHHCPLCFSVEDVSMGLMGFRKRIFPSIDGAEHTPNIKLRQIGPALWSKCHTVLVTSDAI